MTTTVILVDYGGVLANHYQDPAEATLSALLGADRATMRALLSEKSNHGRAFREARIDEAEFWKEVIRCLGKMRTECPEDAVLSRLWAETYRLDEQVLLLLNNARRVCRTGILSNIDEARSRYLTTVLNIEERIDIYLPSYRLGVTKPSPLVFARATSLVGERFGKSRILYVDDREEHVAAAAAAGWDGIVFSGLEGLRKALTARDILPQSAEKLP